MTGLCLSAAPGPGIAPWPAGTELTYHLDGSNGAAGFDPAAIESEWDAGLQT